MVSECDYCTLCSLLVVKGTVTLHKARDFILCRNNIWSATTICTVVPLNFSPLHDTWRYITEKKKNTKLTLNACKCTIFFCITVWHKTKVCTGVPLNHISCLRLVHLEHNIILHKNGYQTRHKPHCPGFHYGITSII